MPRTRLRLENPRRPWARVPALILFANVSLATAQERTERPASASQAADEGTFLPFSTAASHAAGRASTQFASLYDMAIDRSALRGEAGLKLVGPLGLRAGTRYGEPAGSWHPFAGGWFDILTQANAGVSLGLHARFERLGASGVPQMVAGFALGRSIGNARLLGTAEYGNSFVLEERYGAIGAAALTRLAGGLRVGWDSRFQLDLERDRTEPANEVDWRATGGPLLIATKGSFSATGGLGLTALRYRLSSLTEVGAVVFGGVGAVY